MSTVNIQSNENELLIAALYYRSLGWSVIPIKPKDKKPAIKWEQYQTERASEEQIRAWWKKWPRANVGIVTGAISGIIVLDEDGPEGRQSLIDKELPPTTCAVTGSGGNHYVFKHPGSEVRNFARRLPGLDLRGDGGYIVAPPSVHPSGGTYKWGLPPEMEQPCWAPAWLKDLLEVKSTSSNGSRVNPGKVLAGIPEGSRDTEIFKYAASLRARGMKMEEAEVLVLQAAAACTPPFPREEALAKIESAWRYPNGSDREQVLEKAREQLVDITPDSIYDEEILGALALLKSQAPGEYAKIKQTLKGKVNFNDLERAVKYELAQNLNLRVLSGGKQKSGKKPLPRTPEGLSKRFLNLHRNETLWVEAWKSWMIYDGRRWKRDDTVRIIARAKDVARTLLQEAYKADDPDERRALREFSEKAESVNTIKELLTLTKPEVAATPDQFDTNPWLFNCINGTVDLKTGELKPHSPTDYITCLCPIDANPTAQAPQWEQFLLNITRNDQQLVRYLKRCFGMCLTGVTWEQVFFLLWGAGANGKSTLLNTILSVLGRDYGAQASMTAFLARKYDTGASEELASLAGARLVVATETQRGRRLNEAAIKAITGGDRLRVRRLYENSWEFTPQFKVVLCSNYKPNATGTDEALWRRARLIPFLVKFEGAQRDNNLQSKLLEERTGILRWLIEGCLEWQRDGLETPTAVTSATSEWQTENDITAQFLESCCRVGSHLKCRVRDLYSCYENWAADSQETALSQRRFNQEIRDRGFQTFAGTGNVTWWTGLGLPSDFDSS